MTDVSRKAAPRPSPETQPFWDGCAEGELRLQRCIPCNELYFPPRPACPQCLSEEVKWETLSGRGTLHTYLINHRAAPGFEAPYAIAVVELDEGPRMMSNIVGVEQTPEALVLDMPLEVTFEERGHVMLPLFKPAGVQS
jgi:uncharacterized OB-fold protein